MNDNTIKKQVLGLLEQLQKCSITSGMDGEKNQANSNQQDSQIDAVPKFPVPGKQFSEIIQGTLTEFTLCSYDDFIFVLATQVSKLGTMLEARKEQAYGAQATFSINVLLGKRDEPMLQACARQLIEHISNAGQSRPLFLSLGLKDHSLETMKAIVETVIANKIW